MNLTRLAHFVAVAEAGGFTAAATRLGIGQSAVSTSIRRLEESLDAQLFARNPRRPGELTPAGHALLPEARRLLADVETVRDVVHDAGAGLRGAVRFGTLEFAGGADVGRVMAAFRREHPHVRLHHQGAGMGASDLVEQVRQRRLDFAVTAAVRPAPGGVTFHDLEREPYAFIVAERHPRVRGVTCVAKELAGEAFVGSPTGSPERADLEHLFGLLGIRPRVVYETNGLDETFSVVRESGAVALMPRFMAAAFGPGLVAVAPSTSLPPCRSVVAIPDGPGLRRPAHEFLQALLATTPMDTPTIPESAGSPMLEIDEAIQ